MTGNKKLSPLKMVAASICIPKYDPDHPRGQDAHFIAAKEQCIGVADGVGGWTKHGIDSGVYANQLMLNSLKSLKKGKRRPKRVLEEAYSKTTAPGSSTACIVSYSGGVLRAANIGDSGFLVIRDGRVLYRSPTQQHSFNCPFQLGSERGDNPRMAQEIVLDGLEKGDLVLLATDGVLDNMHESEMLDIVSMLLLANNHNLDLEELCSYIAKIALFNSLDRYTDTPFSTAARQAGIHHAGGKIDDITLIVARLV